MIWDMDLAKKIADFDFTYVIDLGGMVDTSEGVTLTGAMDAYREAVKREYPAVGNMARVNLETDARRDLTNNTISVVIRWAYRSVRAAYIPSEDNLFEASFPVGPHANRFRLPVQPSEIIGAFNAFRNQPITPDYKEYTIRGFDDERQAWVYEEVGVPVAQSLVDKGYARASARGRASMPGGRTYRSAKEEYEMNFTDDDLRQELMRHQAAITRNQARELLGLSPKKRALKDMPVRESGLGIW